MYTCEGRREGTAEDAMRYAIVRKSDLDFSSRFLNAAIRVTQAQSNCLQQVKKPYRIAPGAWLIRRNFPRQEIEPLRMPKLGDLLPKDPDCFMPDWQFFLSML